MAQVKEDIKNSSFKKAYLLFGEEAYLRNYYKKALRNALVSPDDTLNYSYFEGSNTDIGQVVDLINTMPFMADHRVVLCENTGWMAKEEGSESANLSMLTDALENIGEDVVFILSEQKADKRSKLFKLINKIGVVEEYKAETEDNLARWCMGYLRNQGKAIQPSVAGYLVSEVGTDMTLLSLELDKLAAWCLDRNEVTQKDVDTVCTHQVNGKIFDMITAISQKRQKEALRLYYDLLTLRESPFHIQSLLVRQYNNMLVIKDGLNRGYSAQIIAQKAGMQDWLVRRMSDTVRRMTLRQIRDCIEACAKAEEDIKTGNMADTLSIELLIISLSNNIKVQ